VGSSKRAIKQPGRVGALAGSQGAEPGWHRVPEVRGMAMAVPSSRNAGARGRGVAEPKAGSLSGCVTAAMTRAAWRGGIGHAGTGWPGGVALGGGRGAGRGPQCPGRHGRVRRGHPVPGVQSLWPRGAGGWRGCSQTREVLSTPIPRGSGLSASPVTLRIVQ